jgi:hypothetical protein
MMPTSCNYPVAFFKEQVMQCDQKFETGHEYTNLP